MLDERGHNKHRRPKATCISSVRQQQCRVKAHLPCTSLQLQRFDTSRAQNIVECVTPPRTPLGEELIIAPHYRPTQLDLWGLLRAGRGNHIGEEIRKKEGRGREMKGGRKEGKGRRRKGSFAPAKFLRVSYA